MHTEICDRYGIEFPIFAFSHCRDVVAAVSRAGGFGVLGALAFGPEQLAIELDWIDEHVGGKPYGVDLVIPAKFVSSGEDDRDLGIKKIQEMIPEEHWAFRWRRGSRRGSGSRARSSLRSSTRVCACW